jgi:hypothetical protein
MLQRHPQVLPADDFGAKTAALRQGQAIHPPHHDVQASLQAL